MNDDTKYRGWDAVNAHRAWRKALYRDHNLRCLAAYTVRKPFGVDIRQVAEVIADEGINGFNCFPSVEAVAELIGCSPRTVQKYRQELLKLGWFRETSRSGGSNHRSLVIEIAIPKGENEHVAKV